MAILPRPVQRRGAVAGHMGGVGTLRQQQLDQLRAAILGGPCQARPARLIIHGIDIGHLDEDGQPVTSAVLVPAMTMAAPRSGKAGRGKNQTAAMRALHELSQIARQQMEAQGIDQDDVWVSGAAWRARCIETERIPRQRFAEVAKSLVDAGLVAVNDERVRVGDPEFDRPNE